VFERCLSAVALLNRPSFDWIHSGSDRWLCKSSFTLGSEAKRQEIHHPVRPILPGGLGMVYPRFQHAEWSAPLCAD
jgi:hypothetical protein